jgi:hypothetical protein
MTHSIVIGVKDIMRIAGRDGTKLFSKHLGSRIHDMIDHRLIMKLFP